MIKEIKNQTTYAVFVRKTLEKFLNPFFTSGTVAKWQDSTK